MHRLAALLFFLCIPAALVAQHHFVSDAAPDRSLALLPDFQERSEQSLDEFRAGFPEFASERLSPLAEGLRGNAALAPQIASLDLFGSLAAYLQSASFRSQAELDGVIESNPEMSLPRTQALLLSALEFFAHRPLRRADIHAGLARLNAISDQAATAANVGQEVNLWRAEGYRAFGQFAQAEAAYAAAVNTASNARISALALFRLAELDEREDRLSQADSTFGLASKIVESPLMLLSLLREAATERSLERFDAAYSTTKTADSLYGITQHVHPAFERDLFYQSRLIQEMLLARTEHDRILGSFDPPRQPNIVPQLVSPYYQKEIALLRGSALSGLGRYDEAAAILQNAQESIDSVKAAGSNAGNSEFPTEGRFVANAIGFERAWSLFQHKQYKDAASAFLELAVADTSDRNRIGNRGSISSLRERGEFYDPFLNDSLTFASNIGLPASSLEMNSVDTVSFYYNDFPERARYYAGVALVRAGMLSEASDVLERLAVDKTILYSDLAAYQLALIRFGQHSYEAAKLLEPVASEQSVRGAYAALLLGELAYRRGAYERAEAYFLNSYANLPNDDTPSLATAHLERGLALIQMNAWHDAADELHTYLNQSHEHVTGRTDQALFWLGKAYLRDAQYDSAFTIYSRMLQEYPNSTRRVDAQYGYAWSLFEANDYARAADAFQRVIQMDSISRFAYDVLARAGDSYYALGNFPKADDLYNAAVDRPAFNDLRTTRALLMLGVTRFRMDSARSAMNIFNYLVNRYPKSDITDEAHFNRGLAAFSINLTSDAEHEMQTIVGQYHQSALAPRALFVEAQERERRNDLHGSVAIYQTLLRDYPHARETGSALFALQNALLVLKRPTEALAVADTFMQHNPESPLGPDLLVRSGEISLRLNQAARAQELLQSFVAKYPTHTLRPRADLLLARAAIQSKDTAGAFAMWSRIIAQYDSLGIAAEARLDRARTERKQNLHDRASQDFQAAFNMRYYSSDAAPQAMFEYADMLSEEKKTDSSIAIFRDLSYRYPIEASIAARAAIRAGELFEEKDEHDSARAEYQRVMTAHPGNALGGAAAVRIGESYNAEKQYPQAIAALEAAKKNYPLAVESEARRLLALAEADIATGHNPQAALLLRELIRSPGITAHQRTMAVGILAQITPQKKAAVKPKKGRKGKAR